MSNGDPSFPTSNPRTDRELYDEVNKRNCEMYAEIERLTRERDQLLSAIGEHVTVRSEQYAQIQRLTRERDEKWGGVRELALQRNAAFAERDRLRAALEEVRRCLPGTLERVPELRDRIDQALSGEPTSAHETNREQPAKYAIIVTGKEARSGATGNPVVGAEGERYWVCEDREGWVPATSRAMGLNEEPPPDLLTFDSRERAEKFAKGWKGHPWWCVPKAHEIVQVVPRQVIEARIVGYDAERPPLKAGEKS